MAKRHQRILILGGTGFVGRHLCARLDREKYDITVITRLDAQRHDLWVLPRVRIIEADPHNEEQLTRALRGHDAAINLIGILNEKGRDGSGFQRAHVGMTKTVIAACRKANVKRYLHMSALGAGKGQSHYQKTKGEAERIALAAGEEDLQVTVFKPSVIFGPGDSFILRFAGLLRWFAVLPLACPNARMAPVFIGNVVEAFLRCLNDRTSFGKSYQLCGPASYTLKELVEYTARTLAYRRLIIGLPDWASRMQGSLLDFVPGKPFSKDNYLSLKTDNVCEHNDLEQLDIAPLSIESVVPGYLGVNERQFRLGMFRRHRNNIQ